MANIVIVKNNTGSSIFIQDLGLELPGSGQRIFSDIFDFTEICVSEDLKAFIADSTFTINNGISDLIIDDAIEYLDCKSGTENTFGTYPSDIFNLLNLINAESESLSETTLLTFQDKLTIITPAITGIIRLGFSMEYGAAQNNKQVEVRFFNVTDNVDISAGSQATNNSTNFFAFNGFHYQELTGVAKTFSLQYRGVSGTCAVRNAHIEMWRVS